jgi:hypothetical protein
VTAAPSALGRASERNVAPAAVCLAAAVATGIAVTRGYGLLIPAGVGATLFGLLLLSNPAVALLGYVATRPVVDAFVLTPVGPVTLGQAWGAGLLLVLIVFLVGTKSRRGASARAIPLPIAAFLGLYVVLALRGEPSMVYELGLKLAMWLLLIVAVERIARTSAGQALCFRAGYALSLGTAVLIGILIATNRYGAEFYSTFDQDTGQGPQGLAFLALFAIPFPLIALVLRLRTRLSLALVVALTIEITLSYVRTSLIALAVVCLVYVFVAVRRRRYTALALTGAFAVTAYVVQGQIAARFSDLTLLFSGDASEAGSRRIEIWSAVWHAATGSMATFFVGGGAGASNDLAKKASDHHVDAHNDVLEFLATGGVVLAAAYIALVLWAGVSVWRLHRDPAQSSRARAVAAVAFGVIGAFVVTSSFAVISYYAALVGFAILLGLVRGMASTPGRTWVDPPRTATAEGGVPAA